MIMFLSCCNLSLWPWNIFYILQYTIFCHGFLPKLYILKTKIGEKNPQKCCKYANIAGRELDVLRRPVLVPVPGVRGGVRGVLGRLPLHRRP